METCKQVRDLQKMTALQYGYHSLLRSPCSLSLCLNCWLSKQVHVLGVLRTSSSTMGGRVSLV